MLGPIVLTVTAFVIWFLVKRFRESKKRSIKTIDLPFPKEWRIVLLQKVAFYNSLDAGDKKRFENKIQQFLLNHKVTGVDVEIDTVDRILVASSAVMLTFEFDNWYYTTLDEVLIYPNAFNEKFETAGPDRRILGMVGSGYMEGKMILSKPALHHGFSNTSDKKNTAIHEFVHLIDKADGSIDGLPTLLLENQYAIPWLNLVSKKIDAIYDGSSDINPYGGTNKQEFFAVASEYFFERPTLLERKHPELHDLLEKVFDQDMSERDLSKKRADIGRNDPCPCGSGDKFKRCCGKRT